MYWLIATPMNAGMLPPTEMGTYEIRQWHGLKESLSGPDSAGGRNQPDLMLPYAIALDAAQPWLNDPVSAPSWFGSDGPTSLRGLGLDVAYHGFLSAPEWGLAGRSERAAEAAAGPSVGAQQERSQWETLNAERTANRDTVACGGGGSKEDIVGQTWDCFVEGDSDFEQSMLMMFPTATDIDDAKKMCIYVSSIAPMEDLEAARDEACGEG